MTRRPHPRVQARGTRTTFESSLASPSLEISRAMIYSPSTERAQALADELASHAIVQIGRGIPDVVAALVEDPPPRPQIFVVDIDQIGPAELFELHAIREQGWCGTIIAIGTVPLALRRSLNIERVLPPKYYDGALRQAIGAIRFDQQTLQIPRVVG